MDDQNEPLRELLASCTYEEFVQTLELDIENPASLMRHVRPATAGLAQAMIDASLRLCVEDLEDDERLVLHAVREVCYAHVALLELCLDEEPFTVDPRRLYAYADDDLFFIADYARAVTIEPPQAGPLPAIKATHRQVATVAASALAALAARGYDPPPTTDRGAERLFGAHVMNDVLRPDDLSRILGSIRDLVPYAAQCAAPVFAELYELGHSRYQPEHAATILAAVMSACEDPAEVLDEASVDEPEDTP